MAAPVLPELVSQWALTDQTLAMTALCLQHVPAEKERVLRCFSDELSEERDRLLHLLGDANECARLAASQPFFRRPQPTRGISRKNAFEKPAVREKNAAALTAQPSAALPPQTVKKPARPKVSEGRIV